MPEYFDCPYLGARVELTDERRRHIQTKRAEDTAEVLANLPLVLAEPSYVFRSVGRRGERAFVRRSSTGRTAFVVAIIASDEGPPIRHWIVTAWLGRRLPGGIQRWTRDL